MAKNLWILTEEHPKMSVVAKILQLFASDYKCGFIINSLRIIPILDKGNCFSFTYEVIGVVSRNEKCFERIFIKTVSGASSFVDFLIFFQEDEPTINDKPIYAIEVTKTDDSESRNTGVYQRCSKFVFINNYYPDVKKIMLYDLQIKQTSNPTETNIFGTRLLQTIGVQIAGKLLDENTYKPFASIDEIIDFKRNMRKAPKGNVPISIQIVTNDTIEISGRLVKSNRLSHDPNIGALSIISAVLRKLGWNGKIVITQHGLSQNMLGKDNKFIQIANTIGIQLKGLILPQTTLPKEYWHYDLKGEKLGTIFIHITAETFANAYSIFENHAGCEKGYFITDKGEPIALPKYVNRASYKSGNKSAIYYIPDLILLDNSNDEIINIEGKKYENKNIGIAELGNYDDIERDFINRYYPQHIINRTVVLYGSATKQIIENEIGFLLNAYGELILGPTPPRLFTFAINNLKSFWN